MHNCSKMSIVLINVFTETRSQVFIVLIPVLKQLSMIQVSKCRDENVHRMSICHATIYSVTVGAWEQINSEHNLCQVLRPPLNVFVRWCKGLVARSGHKIKILLSLSPQTVTCHLSDRSRCWHCSGSWGCCRLRRGDCGPSTTLSFDPCCLCCCSGRRCSSLSSSSSSGFRSPLLSRQQTQHYHRCPFVWFWRQWPDTGNERGWSSGRSPLPLHQGCSCW